MNTVITSRGAILDVCLKMASDNGLESIDIRGVAQSCGVSVGSIYNYFPSKGDLLIAVVEEVWKDIFQMNVKLVNYMDFSSLVRWIFEKLSSGTSKYPSFFTLHSMSFVIEDKNKGRRVMDNYFKHIKLALRKTLDNDEKIKADVFTEEFTEEKLIDFVFSNVLTLLLLKGNYSCDTLIEFIEKVIY